MGVCYEVLEYYKNNNTSLYYIFMKTLKEYANENHITYEAIRQQVKRYEKELGNHIKKIKRTKYLDEFAIEFLDKKE